MAELPTQQIITSILRPPLLMTCWFFWWLRKAQHFSSFPSQCLIKCKFSGTESRSNSCGDVSVYHVPLGRQLSANMQQHVGMHVQKHQRGDLTRFLSSLMDWVLFKLFYDKKTHVVPIRWPIWNTGYCLSVRPSIGLVQSLLIFRRHIARTFCYF